MKRALIILALAALIAVVVLTAGYGWLFQSPSGRAFIKARLASELGALIGGEAEIRALKGLPPAHIILENVSLRDADGEWLLIPQATIDWRPFALLHGDVIINSASIDKARLTRALTSALPGARTSSPSLARATAVVGSPLARSSARASRPAASARSGFALSRSRDRSRDQATT